MAWYYEQVFLDCSKISVISVYGKIFEKHCGAMAMSLHLFELAGVFWTIFFGKSKIPSLILCLVIIAFYLAWSSVTKLLMRSAVVEKINVLSNRIP